MNTKLISRSLISAVAASSIMLLASAPTQAAPSRAEVEASYQRLTQQLLVHDGASPAAQAANTAQAPRFIRQLPATDAATLLVHDGAIPAAQPADAAQDQRLTRQFLVTNVATLLVHADASRGTP